ncbi:MAG TPA: molybdopterin-binding protein [Steroidobacteraceae bacterium]|jgi:DMSO/TMAO reductase YedYZ molybdopterin-dependent catalytic subunit
MTTKHNTSRRSFLRRAGVAATGMLVAGCDALSQSPGFVKLLGAAEHVSHSVQRALTPRRSMAQEFSEADLSPSFRSNGTDDPDDARYQSLAQNGFADWRLEVDGLVEQSAQLSIEQLRAMRSRTQITRHDCVEGWSAIGKWKGVPLGKVLALVRPKPAARYVVFHCADPMDSAGTRYYESIDMEDAYHPQTILAYELNDAPLPIANGAPLRVRIERQLGYKMAKYIMRLEVVESFAHIGAGRGGFWEDQGYEWYAGI